MQSELSLSSDKTWVKRHSKNGENTPYPYIGIPPRGYSASTANLEAVHEVHDAVGIVLLPDLLQPPHGFAVLYVCSDGILYSALFV